MRQKEQPAAAFSNSLQTDVSAIETLIGAIAQKHNLSSNQVLALLTKTQTHDYVPSSIFKNKNLGFMEALIKFLKEEHQLTFHQIAQTLKRDDRVIWTTYHNSQKKTKEKLVLVEPSIPLPISIFTKDNGPLQSIAIYLRDELKMGFSEIAQLIDRKTTSVWACYHKKFQEKESLGRSDSKLRNSKRSQNQ